MSDSVEKPLAGKRILFLAAQTPYPPDGGGAIRNLAFLEYLAGAGAEITLLCFGRDVERDAVARRELARFCAAIEIVPPPTARSKKERLRDLARGKADMSGRLASPAFDLRVRTLVYEQNWASVHFQGLEIAAPYIGNRLFFPPPEALKAIMSELQEYTADSETSRNAMQAKKTTPRPRIVLDEFNAEYLLQERAVKNDLRSVLDIALLRRAPKAWLRAGARTGYSWLQARRLRKVERYCIKHANKIIVTSPTDREALIALYRKELAAPDPGPEPIHVPMDKTSTIRNIVTIRRDIKRWALRYIKTHIPGDIFLIPNGVDGAYFAPQPEVPEIAGRIIFTGTMDYRPNVDAVTWFVEAILPQVRAARPDAEFWIVGRKPTDAILALAQQPGVVVKADVPDVRPLMAAAAVYVVPMRIGGGVRFKALEALAMAKAVVSTPLGVDGLDLTAERDLLVEKDEVRFAQAVVQLLNDPAQRANLGVAGHDWISQNFDWRSLTPHLLDLYTEEAAPV